MKKFFAALLLLLLGAAAAHASGAQLWAHHISFADMINGETKYDNASFAGVWLHVRSYDVTVEQKHLDAKGIMTLDGGFYTFNGETNYGGERSFELLPDLGDMYIGYDELDYGPPTASENSSWFIGSADTGLNGVKVSWEFPTLPELDGSCTISDKFLSTAEQLQKIVPYIKLNYDASGKVTSINWAIVDPNDISKPISVNYPSRVRIRSRANGEDRTWTEDKYEANVVLSGVIDADGFDPSQVDLWIIRLFNRTDPDNRMVTEWRLTPKLELELADKSKPFDEWQQSPEEFFSGIESYGHIPDPIDLSHLDNNAVKTSGIFFAADALPSAYDLRDDGGLPAVRNQGNYRTCWAHAAMSSMESSYMKQGLSTKKLGLTPDLSELHMAWFVYKDPQEGRAFTANTSNILDIGGYESQPVAFLTRMAGAVSETSLPYSSAASVETVTSGKKPEDYSVAIRIKNIYQLGTLNENNRELAKRLIMEYGAVKIAYLHDKSGFNKSSAAYYYPSNKCWGHALTLVGWDDNFSRDNFSPNKPAKNGAWLARNSRGNGWGDGGYFWISYEQNIGEATVYSVASDSKNLYHYGHDALGRTRSVNCQWSANVFQAKNDGEVLHSIGFYTTDNNAEYDIAVYKFGDDKPVKTPVNGEAVISLKGTMAVAGYHTLELPQSIELKKGEYFTVAAKMSTQFSYPTAVEETSYIANAVINSGESFFSLDGLTWADGSNTSAKDEAGLEATPYANACLKAFTYISSQQQNDESEGGSTGKGGGGGGGCAAVNFINLTALLAVCVFYSARLLLKNK
ncbi:MAG: hypothetical protein IJQ63_12305 [Synergistaceae bacterium]|nr:hypothetical protein [Synergistaceae bacterium]